MALRNVSASPRKKPRQARATATVNAVLEAAARVFKERGYARATTNRIADLAGVSIGSLYEYFPNKEALLGELARRHMREGFALATTLLVEGLSGADVARLARAGLEGMLALHDRDVQLHRMLFEETSLPTALRSEVLAMAEPLVDAIAALLARSSDVRVPDPRLAAVVVVQVTEALAHGFVLHPPRGVSREAFVDEGARLLRAYLSGAG